MKLLPSQLVTQIALVPAAMPPHGLAGPGTAIVAWIAFVASLIRTTDGTFGTSTQMLPDPSASQLGPDGPASPTGIVATTLFVFGSMRTTLPLRVWATQIAAFVTSTPFCRDPVSIDAVDFRVRGSNR